MASRAMLSLVDGGPDRRQADRVRLLLTARLVTTSDEYAVMLRDISLTGAMVEGSHLPSTGVDVILQRGELEIFSTLVWVKDRRAGLEFETPLTVQDFVSKFARTAWAPHADEGLVMPHQTGVGSRTAADWKWAKAWAARAGQVGDSAGQPQG